MLQGRIRAGAQRPARERRLGHRHLPRHLTLDDLPRALPGAAGGGALTCAAAASRAWASACRAGLSARWGSVHHAVEAGRRCLDESQYRPADVGVLINAGVHRDGHICEPAIAAYIQHRLGINVEFQGRRTLSFDLLNGGCGMLNAAQVAIALLQGGRGAGRDGGRERGQQRPSSRPAL